MTFPGTTRPAARRGTSFVEILTATCILCLCLIPVVRFYTRVSELPAISEDRTNAEILATRILERWGSRPYEELVALDGQEKADVLDELFEADRDGSWYGDHPEYARNLGIERKYFRGSLRVKKLADGLLALDAIVRFKTSERGAQAKTERSFALVRLVARSDLGVAHVKGEPEL